MLATKITEGESGLIPRQEYETLAFIQQFLRYPELLSFLLHFDCRLAMGDTGPYDLGDGRLMIASGTIS